MVHESPFRSVRLARRRRWPTVLRGVGIGVAALAVLALVVTLALWRYASSKIDTISPSALETPPAGAPVDDDLTETLNVLVVGNDSREGLTDEELQRLGTEAEDGANTDTIILVQLSPVREEVVLLSFPRDLRVDIPGEGTGKINAAYALGGQGEPGADLLIRTVQDYTGIPIDHYVEVDLFGFLQLTDAVGGVEVCLDEPAVDVPAGLDLPAGCQHIDGYQAAGYVRARKQLCDRFGCDDFGRMARQQYFIKQAMQEVTSAGTLLNPLKVKRLIDVVAGAVRTDRDLSATEMLRLANALRDFDPERITTRTVPGYWKTPYVYAYPEQAESLFQALRAGEALPEVGTTEAEDLTPEDVRVEVRNGVGTEGLASKAQAFLEQHGFVVHAVGNVDGFGVEVTRVLHTAGNEAKAELVAARFPGAELVVVEESDVPSGADVVVEIGEDWDAEA